MEELRVGVVADVGDANDDGGACSATRFELASLIDNGRGRKGNNEHAPQTQDPAHGNLIPPRHA